MEPKMTLSDAAKVLKISEDKLLIEINKKKLEINKKNNIKYFDHYTAREIFKLKLPSRVVAFQIIKGGTGKTSISQAFAIRSSLYGLKVLCIDLDQQGNLTQSFNIDAEDYPIMIDILAEGYSLESSITTVANGIDLLASRIENSSLDDVIKFKRIPLESVYEKIFAKLKTKYDVIVIDCPPNLGQSVASIALSADLIIAPVVTEQFALSGLELTLQAIDELQSTYNKEILFAILLNKYDPRKILTQSAEKILSNSDLYKYHLLPNKIRVSQDFPNSIAKKDKSIFDDIKKTVAKKDVDCLVREVLAIDDFYSLKKDSKTIKVDNKNKVEETTII